MSKFNELSKIDCTDHIEKKGNLSYISWASAWQMLCEKCPDATYEHHDAVTYPSGEMMVSCTVTVDGISHRMHLPVLDHRNKPIQGPNVFQINTSMQRCFAKAISMHGLGLYVYRGEDLPPTTPYDAVIAILGDATEEELSDLWDDGPKFHELINSLSEEEQNEAFNGAPDGQKSAFKKRWRAALSGAEQTFESLTTYIQDAIKEQDSEKLAECWSECSDYEKAIIRNRLNNEERESANQLLGGKK